jgi:hypothetical protein
MNWHPQTISEIKLIVHTKMAEILENIVFSVNGQHKFTTFLFSWHWFDILLLWDPEKSIMRLVS